MEQEVFSAYLLPVIMAILTAVAGFIGTQIKALYEKYVSDKTKEAVVRTCVKAAEQLYHDLSGPEKLRKTQQGVVDMLNEKGIPISELEMNMLIESVVSEFNYGFEKGEGKKLPGLTEGDPSAAAAAPPLQAGEAREAYSEEGGSL